MTSAVKRIPKFDGANPDICRDRHSETCAVLFLLSNEVVFDALNGSPERSPICSGKDTAETGVVPDNVDAFQRWRRASSPMFVYVTLPPANLWPR